MATKIWAHRGASASAPENTIEAFLLAEQMGADGIELDIQLSADGEIVVLHDETVDRTASGSGRVCDLTLTQLKELDFSFGMPDYAGARIPTLREVYAAFAQSRMFFNVEIKCEQGDYRTLCEKALRLEKEAGMEGRILYSSFNWDALRQVRALCPNAEIALLYERALWAPQKYALQMGAGAVHPSKYTLLVPGVVRRCHRFGVRVHAWTIDSPFAIRRLARMGADAIITNRPDVAREILKK